MKLYFIRNKKKHQSFNRNKEKYKLNEEEEDDANDDEEKPCEVNKELSSKDNRNQEKAGTNFSEDVGELITELDNGNYGNEESKSKIQVTVKKSSDIKLLQVRNLEEAGVNVNKIECRHQCYEEEGMDCELDWLTEGI